MIDYFTIALTHGLIALAAWRLVQREDLDVDPHDSTSRKSRITEPGDA